MIWLRGKKQLIGLVRWPSGGLTLEDELRIDIRGESIQAAMVDVEAIALSPALHPPLKQESGGKVIGLEDGSLLQVSKWKVLPNKVQLSLLSLNDIVTWDGQAEFASSVRYLSSMPGGAVFLSSLEPASYRHITDSTLAWPLGRDRDLWGRPLMISHENSVGEVFHGLAMHSSSQVAYRWDRSAGRFLSEVRLAVPQPGSFTELGDADCRVLLAREGKLVEVDAFHLNRRSEKSDYHTVDVDLSNAQLLVLVVEQGTLGQYGDHVLWLDARIVRE